MKRKEIEEFLAEFNDRECDTENREIELTHRYHEGVRDGYRLAAEEFAGTDDEDTEAKACNKGFMEAVEMLGAEFGVDTTKTRANTKGGIIRAAARQIREASSGAGDDGLSRKIEDTTESLEETYIKNFTADINHSADF